MAVRGWSLKSRPGQMIAALGILAARDASLAAAAEELVTEWKQILNQPGSGKLYAAGTAFITTGGTNRRVVEVGGSPESPSRASDHRASAPGEAPAPDQGDLKNSIDRARMPDGSWRVGTGMRIGLALEYGVNVSGSQVGPHPAEGHQLQPRPHARPAMKAAEDGMTAVMVSGLKAGVKGPPLTSG